jgi:hypothetical protein
MENHLALFRMPTPMKITGRASSITNAFINSIIPVIFPTEDEVREALGILAMTTENFQCTYCGATASEWDHLRPLVMNQKPTGYISEIQNLVPSCGKCNQSKGNREWRKWIQSEAKLSPKTRGVQDLIERSNRLEDYENWREPTCLKFDEIVDRNVWEEHWSNGRQILDKMKTAQKLSEQINARIREEARR